MMCVPVPGYSAINHYACACAAGYIEYNCNVDFDECAAKPCNGTSTCVNEVNSYSCQCGYGYSGPSTPPHTIPPYS